MKRPTRRLVVSIGCPSGIGPEVSVVAATQSPIPIVLVGDLGVLRAAAKLRGIDPKRLVCFDDAAAASASAPQRTKGAIVVYQPTAALSASDRKPGLPSRAGGAAQLAWIDAATDLVSAAPSTAALVTGPVSKEAIARSGAKGAKKFRGHTEHLAERLHAREVTMAFWTEALTTSLVTTHLALADVPKAITKQAVARAVFWTVDFLARLHAKAKANAKAKKAGTLAVAALNPHAGEGGLLGAEEKRFITPGIKLARTRLARAAQKGARSGSRDDASIITIEGPVPAESAFRQAASGHYLGVVAMYHDQATIPMKILGFGEAVNVSLGLPIIRTSVDHGTAYDRAGKGTGDARGMIAAMTLAARLLF